MLWTRIVRLARLRYGLPFIRRADRARDRGEWIEAVIDYRRGLERMPWRQDLNVQIGNCLKEFGDYRGAMRAYGAVRSGPSLSEARKQAADVSRRAGTTFLPFRTAESADAAETLAVATPVPRVTERLLPNRIRLDPPEARGWLGSLGREGHVSTRLRGAGFAAISLDQVGAMVLERAGAQEPLLAGVVAIRGRISALATPGPLELCIGSEEEAFRMAVPLRRVAAPGPLQLFVFNAWVDSSRLPPGHQWLALRAGNSVAPTGLFVNVADSGTMEAFGASNGFVSLAEETDELDHAVAALPAAIRSAGRTLFDSRVESVLALRVDQLGDVAASLPALARLRALFPGARLTVLAQPAVCAVIEASAVADEVLPITLGYDPVTGHRSLDAAEEDRVRDLLTARAFDLAIDLSPGDESRPLLLLTGATYLVGFNPDRFPFLDFGIAVRSRDKINQKEKLSHAAAVMMQLEALAVALAPGRPVVPRSVEPDRLAALGLRPQGHVVLHLGARHEINRWPAAHFATLCRRLLAETVYDVVVFAGDDAGAFSASDDPRVHRFGLLDPDLFDCVLSSAKAMVGNDSGPKHLAAARGVPTVSVHVDRLNWNEWGQDGIGAIVSKRVPCTGCGLNDIELCGRDAVCVRAITVDEVHGALRPYL